MSASGLPAVITKLSRRTSGEEVNVLNKTPQIFNVELNTHPQIPVQEDTCEVHSPPVLKRNATSQHSLSIRLEAMALRLEAMALRLEAMALRLEAIASRLEAIALWLEAIALRLEAMASRLEAMASGYRLHAKKSTHTYIDRSEGTWLRADCTFRGISATCTGRRRPVGVAKEWKLWAAKGRAVAYG